MAIFLCWETYIIVRNGKIIINENRSKITFAPFWEELYDEMISHISSIRSGDSNKVGSAIQCVQSCREAIGKLKEYIQSTPFNSKEDEINFFKRIKPRFQSQLIFYIKIYSIEINWPTGSKLTQENYLSGEFYKLKVFFDHHTAFYHYFRSGETYLDEHYFIRQNNTIKESIRFLYIDADTSFSTIYDYQIARILANEMVSDYLNKALFNLNNNLQKESPEIKPLISWSDSKVALAELLYALHASGVFNNSQADIKTITDSLSGIFNVKIGNVYKMFEEIRLRKKNRTVFLDFLRENLIQRMNRDDEQAL